jgi:hypothetical protein
MRPDQRFCSAACRAAGRVQQAALREAELRRTIEDLLAECSALRSRLREAGINGGEEM